MKPKIIMTIILEKIKSNYEPKNRSAGKSIAPGLGGQHSLRNSVGVIPVAFLKYLEKCSGSVKFTLSAIW